MKSGIRVLGALVVLLALSACVAGSADSQHAAQSGWIAHFFLGFWHGLIAPVTLIGEVINAVFPRLLPWEVHFYELKGAGVVYDVGFFMGLTGSPLLMRAGWRRRAAEE